MGHPPARRAKPWRKWPTTERALRKASSSIEATAKLTPIATAGSSMPWSPRPKHDEMVEYTRPATWSDVIAVARYLSEAGVEYALVGGYAIAAHGFNRFSEDVDILVNPSRENTARWIAALSRLPDEATRELAGQEDIFEREGHYAIRVND